MFAVLTDAPIVGGVRDSETKVWFRTNQQATVAVEYSTSPTLENASLSSIHTTQSTADHTGIITLTGLLAETKYYYRLVVDGAPQQFSNYPSWTSFAAPGRFRDFTFAVTADLENGTKHPVQAAPVYAQIAADDPHFFLQIGDFDHRRPDSLAEMRSMHRSVRGPLIASGADFAEHIADEFPVFHVWDDHDYGMNNGDKNFPGRAAALEAFKEYFPTPNLPNPSQGIWHSFGYAQADFFMLDLRSQRDPFTDPEGPAKSILDGNNIANGQKAWLKAGLLNSTANWKFVATPVPFNPTTQKKEGWAEYDTERQEILDFINANHIEGVILISGDIHHGGGIDDGTNSGLPEVSVPHTNMTDDHTNTTRSPGLWSEGILTGVGNPGYVLFRVSQYEVKIEIKSESGLVRMSYDIGEIPGGGSSWFRESSDGEASQMRDSAAAAHDTAFALLSDYAHFNSEPADEFLKSTAGRVSNPTTDSSSTQSRTTSEGAPAPAISSRSLTSGRIGRRTLADDVVEETVNLEAITAATKSKKVHRVGART